MPNPANFWVDGFKQKQFTYCPGENLYRVDVSIGDSNFLSCGVFAGSSIHAKTIILDMCKFAIACEEKYFKKTGSVWPFSTTFDYYLIKKILKGKKEGNVSIKLVDKAEPLNLSRESFC